MPHDTRMTENLGGKRGRKIKSENTPLNRGVQMMLSKNKPLEPPKKKTFETGFSVNFFKKRITINFFFDVDKL